MKVKIITTARAIIINQKHEILLVKNSEHEPWFTPGGWVDGFETLEQTCMREVKEETGLQIKVNKLLKIDYFQLTAEQNIKWKENINKIEHYFLCNILSGEVSSNFNNENIWQDEDKGNTKFIKFFSVDELQKVRVAPSWILDLVK